MSSRRDIRERGDYPLPPPSKCAKVLYYTWKLCSVVFSHFVMISLVVAYCILGAVTFEKLEAQNEREVKMNISQIRRNTTYHIWALTNRSAVLIHTNWTGDVVDMLKDFENAILLEMKVRGWDGNEDPSRVQWTFTGALFYSIIVITTIGYGHIAPKTQSGKVVTILYAILGIPLMLLTLSNIGDVMASSFRFLYWRVCCYVCTRPPKRRHRHHHASIRRSVRGGSGKTGSVRRKRPLPPPHPPLERAHSDTDCRYRDSGYSSGHVRRPPPAPVPAPRAPHTPPHTLPRTRSQPPHFRQNALAGHRDFEEEDRAPPAQYDRLCRDPRDHFEDDEPINFPKIALPLQDLEAALKDLEEHQKKMSKSELRSRSLPRPPKTKHEFGPRREFDDHRHFEGEKDFYEMHDLDDVDFENYREKRAREFEDRTRDEKDKYYAYKDREYDPEDDDYEFDNPRSRRNWHEKDRDRSYHGRSEHYYRDRDEFPERERRGRRARSAVYDYERRWDDDRDRDRDDYRRDVETGRHRRLRRLHTVDETRTPYRYTPSPERDDWSDEIVVAPKRGRPPGWEMHAAALEQPTKEEIKPVPIWLCVFLVASYIVAGTFLFKRWEGWHYLDAAYFCFITLTTIGFGDFVPAQGQSQVQGGDATDAVHSIALCSLYLLFGIALLAMSFNLVQEEVRANVAELATKLGIIKPKQQDSESEE